MSYPQQPAPQAPVPAAVPPPPQAPQQQAPAQQAMQPGQVQQNFPPPQDQTGEGSATDAAVGDPVAWQTAAEADARYEIVQRPMNGEVG